MKLFRVIGGLMFCALVQVTPVLAAPTMIRLGYADCAACHVSPQGGGLLTSYGRGVDVAQSARAREIPPSDADTRRYLYDVRFVAVGQDARAFASHTSTASSTFQVQLRNSLRLGDHNRVTYTFGLSAQTLPTSSTQTGGLAQVIVPKAIWEFRPKNGVSGGWPRRAADRSGAADPQAYAQRHRSARPSIRRRSRRSSIPIGCSSRRSCSARAATRTIRARQWGAGTLAGVDVEASRDCRRLAAQLAVGSFDLRRGATRGSASGGGHHGPARADRALVDRRKPGDDAASPVTRGVLRRQGWLVTSLGAEEMAVDGITHSALTASRPASSCARPKPHRLVHTARCVCRRQHRPLADVLRAGRGQDRRLSLDQEERFHDPTRRRRRQ